MTAVSSGRVVEWDRDQLAEAAAEVLDVYSEAMAVPRLLANGRRSILTGHLDRRGLRAVACREQSGRLVGIAYGHLGEPGQWWHDQVQDALTSSLGARDAAVWVGGFEVCELHVRPAFQGGGLGRTLLDRLLGSTSAQRALLTTPDAHTRARGFYQAGGWVDLARQLRFPGDPRLFAVLGLHLPVAEPDAGSAAGRPRTG